MRHLILTILAVIMTCPDISAGNDIGTADTLETAQKPAKAKKAKKEVKYNEKGEIIKTGLNFGPLPVVAFDNDRGFQYGALLNIYNFGDGSTYPNPESYWYVEGSAYTGGSMKFMVYYDNKQLFKNIRLSAAVGYYGDGALDFYGFNGFQSNYDIDYFADKITFDDSKKGQKFAAKFAEKGTIQKGFYRLDRQMVKGKVDFQGKILKNFFWEAGYNLAWFGIKDFTPKGYSVNLGIEEDASTSLYGLYKKWGIIGESEARGGFVSSLRAGLLYDSRNVENNPTRGIWAEGHVVIAPKWLGSSTSSYKFSATMRQYIPLGTDRVVLAYRLAYEGFFGNAPWYAMPIYTNVGKEQDTDGFGSSKTIRGVMLDRLQGLQTGFYNVELRYRFIDFKLWNQNIAFAVSGFTDGGHVFKGYDLTNKTGLYPELYEKFVNASRKDGFHGSAGGGLRFIMNQNFIVAVEYARCFNRQDGKGALYINTGFLF